MWLDNVHGRLCVDETINVLGPSGGAAGGATTPAAQLADKEKELQMALRQLKIQTSEAEDFKRLYHEQRQLVEQLERRLEESGEDHVDITACKTVLLDKVD